MGDVYLWRQVFILITNSIHSLSIGQMVSFPSVLMPALLSKNSTDIEVTANQVSWIATSNGIGGIFGYIVLSTILQKFGRKFVHITGSLFILTGWIIFTQAHSVPALLAARIIQGFSKGSLYIHAIILSEYSDPERRGYFITIKKLSFSFGILSCHSLSLIWSWRKIAMFSTIFPILSFILTLFWPESPAYLAMKGRFSESKKAFIWLHGDSNMKDLQLLHLSQLQKSSNLCKKKWYNFMFKKDIVMPLVIVSVLTMIIDFGGKHYLSIFVIQIMKELVGDKSLAIYFSIAADLMAIVALMFSSFLITHFKRRTILFSFGSIIVSLMLITSIIIVLKLSTKWLSPVLIILHIFIFNVSISPVCFTLSSEVFPLEYKGYCSCLSGIVFASLYTVMLKLIPTLIANTGVEGMYAIFGIILAISLLVLYFILPETKDRYLTEIENEFKGINLLSSEEHKRIIH